ncbi:hypothetical protein BT96DRAFT_752094, partial [Gymnopus androsaceus JB14]
SRLFTNQILGISSHEAKKANIAEQVKALGIVLDSFGNTKPLMESKRFAALQRTSFQRPSLDKSRLDRFVHEERTFQIFYQSIAGCTSAERDSLN